jgi:hypothetical protein
MKIYLHFFHIFKIQLEWLDDYYKRIREKVGPLLNGDKDVYAYFLKITEPIKSGKTVNNAANFKTSLIMYLFPLLISMFGF